MAITLLCEKTRAIALVLLGLMAGGLAGRQADEIVFNSEILRIVYQMKYSSFLGI